MLNKLCRSDYRENKSEKVCMSSKVRSLTQLLHTQLKHLYVTIGKTLINANTNSDNKINAILSQTKMFKFASGSNRHLSKSTMFGIL